jgi:nucleoside 2-deoxyribosyltransferase
VKSLYIAGPIEGVKNYRERFAAAQAVAEGYEWAVLNPATLPAGLAKEAYMPICLAMLNAADAVLMLDGWEESEGAKVERGFALYQGKQVYKQSYFGADIPKVIRERRADT